MPSLDPCTSHGMGHLGWGSCTAPDWAQPGQHLLCLGILLQGAWNLILAAVVEPFHLLFWGEAHGCHLPVQAPSAWGKSHGLSVFLCCCLSFLGWVPGGGGWGHEGWVGPGSEAQQHSLQSC